MTTYQTLLIAYAFIACSYWLWLLVGNARLVRAVPALIELEPPEPGQWPRLSVIVPACNEADAIEAAARTILDQDYPGLEVLLVDDRSTDGTGQIIDRLAAADPCARAIHVDHLPENWLGKVNALATGYDHAHGEFVLFTDADVYIAQNTLRRAVALCEAKGIDHLAIMPDIWPSSLLVDACLATFLRTFPVATRCWAISDPQSRAFIGIGAFNLVRCSAFERTDG
jgi:glycosyltransferase involved in cell wall biosynthesis